MMDCKNIAMSQTKWPPTANRACNSTVQQSFERNMAFHAHTMFRLGTIIYLKNSKHECSINLKVAD